MNLKVSRRVLPVLISVLAILAFGALRYSSKPTFWFDEAAVAEMLKHPSTSQIFARLTNGLYFPRLYLLLIAALREVFGYRIAVLRLLPALSFCSATVLWAWLLLKRARSSWLLSVMSAGLLLGSAYWLDQSVQLKQYTLDVLLSLVPFALSDGFFDEILRDGKRPWSAFALALPACFSYTYPIALLARLTGYYLFHGRKRGWSLSRTGVASVVIPLGVALSALYFIDLRYNLKDAPLYWDYWKDCILLSKFREAGIGPGLGLIGRLFTGWYRYSPWLVVGIAPLQTAGIYSVFKRVKSRDASDDAAGWGSRSAGSLALLGGLILASLTIHYPLCVGRVTLFAQVHTQILVLEGSAFCCSIWSQLPRKRYLMPGFAAVLALCSVIAFVDVAESRPSEDLSQIRTEISSAGSDVVWVHPCSITQFETLDGAPPVDTILLGDRDELPPAGKTVWVVWTHMGNRFCRGRLARIRCLAKSWQVVDEGPNRGLALARF